MTDQQIKELAKFKQVMQHVNAFYKLGQYNALYKGLDMQVLDRVKELRKIYAPSIKLRYVFRGPRRPSMLGQCATMTLKQDAKAFDIYLR